MSACWYLEGTWLTEISPWWTSILKKWWRTPIMCFEFEFDTGFCKSCTAPWLSSKIGKHGIPLPSSMKRHVCLRNNNFFTASPRATYSASDVESVTHFCVLENQHTHAPPHILLRQTQISCGSLYWRRSLRRQKPLKKYLLVSLSDI